MNKHIVLIFLLLVCLAPWACQKPTPVGPIYLITPTETPLPTSTATPVCFSGTTVSLPNGLTQPNGQSCLAGSGGTPVTNIWAVCGPWTPIGNMGAGGYPFCHIFDLYLIQSMSDWQNFYGCTNPPAPPVDLNSQIIAVAVYRGSASVTFGNICETQNQVIVSAQASALENPPITQPPGANVAVAFPKSSLPISWQITIPTNPPGVP